VQRTIIEAEFLLSGLSLESKVRFAKISQSDFNAILKLYEGVMSYACHGLFFREGEALADSIMEVCSKNPDLLECSKKLLIARGWLEDVSFNDKEVRVKGSIEVTEGSEKPTCHRLRGLLSRIMEAHAKTSIRLVEVECRSNGGKECVFKQEMD